MSWLARLQLAGSCVAEARGVVGGVVGGEGGEAWWGGEGGGRMVGDEGEGGGWMVEGSELAQS